MKISKLVKRVLLLLTILGGIMLAFALTLSVYIKKNISFETDEMLFSMSRDSGGAKIYADYDLNDGEYEPVEIENIGSKVKEYFNLSEYSDCLRAGFIAVEDREFYNHCGIDIKRTILAAKSYIFSEDTFGASTITQQVVKNISGDNEVSLKRKLNEIIRARHLEKIHTKDEIFELYLNIVPMSENIYGVGTACEVYFGKLPREINYIEAATLIGVANAPTAYSPYTSPEKCIQKRNIILSVLKNDGIITNEEYEKGISAPLVVVPREERVDRIDGWFCEAALSDATGALAEKYGISRGSAEKMLLRGGFKIYTTMDCRAQKIVDEYFSSPENFSGEIKNGLNYAFCLYDSKTGNLRAIAGRVGEKSQNRILNHAYAPHIPGSTIKPLTVYAPLIDEGKINCASVFDDVPLDFYENEDGSYRVYPKNSPNVYSGLVSVKDAVRKSKNTVAVRLIRMRGVENAYNSLMQDFGFTTLVNDKGVTDIATSPMGLGQLSVGVPLSELTHAYTVFPSGGVLRGGKSFVKILDGEGRVIIENDSSERRIYKEDTCKIINQLLLGVVEGGTAKAININGVEIAGKTGTSGQSRDKLFIGYTPYYTAGIWSGYDKSDRPVSDSTAHLKAWEGVMQKIIDETLTDSQKSEVFSTAGLLYLPFCKDSGGLYTEICSLDARGDRVDYGYFTHDNRPASPCDRHIKVKYDPEEMGVLSPHDKSDGYIFISLVRNDERAFPTEVVIEDAEFIYRDMSGYSELCTEPDKPYFYFTIPDGEYVGISDSKRQFNRGSPKKSK